MTVSANKKLNIFGSACTTSLSTLIYFYLIPVDYKYKTRESIVESFVEKQYYRNRQFNTHASKNMFTEKYF